MRKMGEIGERIATLEQRLTNRRERLREDVDEARGAARHTARRWLPVAAAVGAGLATLLLTRSAHTAPALAAAPAARRGVRWASLLGLATSAYRLGSNPQVRSLFAAFRRRR